jgi:ABC-type amino acid transport substrate-binding protein
MKKLEKIICVLMLMCVTCSAFAWGKKAKKNKLKAGVLSFLNISEKECASAVKARFAVWEEMGKEGALKKPPVEKPESLSDTQIVFYDTLDSMLMALEAGKISLITSIPNTTAAYLCSRNNKLLQTTQFDKKPGEILKEDRFSSRAFNILSSGYSFMMLEKNKALRDEFDTVIRAMKEDGTADKLIKEHIVDVMNGKEIAPIIPEYKEGRKTIKVAVTGSLPPMDYVAADGTFAGYNTAMLAEIGKRLDRNITMVQVSSVGRATALASGTVDVVFWTRSSAYSPVQRMSKEEFKSFSESIRAKQSPEEEVAFAALNETYSGSKDGDDRDLRFHRDTPAGTVITVPYFEDMPVTVGLKN